MHQVEVAVECFFVMRLLRHTPYVINDRVEPDKLLHRFGDVLFVRCIKGPHFSVRTASPWNAMKSTCPSHPCF